jgi:hypothetical protein
VDRDPLVYNGVVFHAILNVRTQVLELIGPVLTWTCSASGQSW